MLKIDIKPSRQFLVLLSVLVLGSEGIVAFLPLLVWIKIALMFTVFLYGFYLLITHGLLLSPRSIIGLARYQKEWILFERQCADKSQAFVANILGCSTVTSKVSVLCFESLTKGQKRALVVFPDALPKGQYRELIVSAKD